MPKTFKFPDPYRHAHPPVRSVNDVLEERLTFGQRASDWLVGVAGSWSFIVIQTLILLVWAVLNLTAWVRHWDPYPFILMNLFLSLQAAFTAPIIMMSQNRQAMKDRIEAHLDFEVNQKAEEEVRAILEHLAAQDQALTVLRDVLEDVVSRLPPRPSAGP